MQEYSWTFTFSWLSTSQKLNKLLWWDTVMFDLIGVLELQVHEKVHVVNMRSGTFRFDKCYLSSGMYKCVNFHIVSLAWNSLFLCTSTPDRPFTFNCYNYELLKGWTNQSGDQDAVICLLIGVLELQAHEKVHAVNMRSGIFRHDKCTSQFRDYDCVNFHIHLHATLFICMSTTDGPFAFDCCNLWTSKGWTNQSGDQDTVICLIWYGFWSCTFRYDKCSSQFRDYDCNFHIHLHATLSICMSTADGPFTFNYELLKGWTNQSGDQDAVICLVW